MILALSVLLAWFAITGNRATDQRTCERFNLLYAGFTDSLERAKASIPTIAYYKTHSDEKARALADVDRQLSLYRQQKC